MPPPRAYVQPAAPATPAATQQPYNYNYGATYAQRPAAAPAAVVPPGSTVIRPVRFNHEKSLLRQYGTYVMFDVAEVMATRAADLVRSCRDQYERELMEGDD
jgi:hypothetical protein